MPHPDLTDHAQFVKSSVVEFREHPDRIRLEYAQAAVAACGDDLWAAARKMGMGGNELRRLLSARSTPARAK